MSLARRLEEQLPEILRQWEARVRASVPAARHESRPVLLDHIPEFLRELVKSLAGAEREDLARRSAPKAHAQQRARHPEYSLQQVVQEYSLLRATILDMCAPVEQPDLRIILDILEGAVAEATTQYVSLQETALRESEERFRLLTESVRDYAIFMLDPQGHIVTWNQGAERITGYSAQEILGKDSSVLYPEESRDDTLERYLNAAGRENRYETEGWRMRKDGTRFFAHVVITAAHHVDGTLRGFSKVVQDVTEKRQLEAELENRASALSEMNRRKDEFLAVLAHELRNPLAPIVSAIELLRRTDLDDSSTRQAIAVIERQARHLMRLVDDILDVARITHGKISLRKEPLEFIRLLSQVTETIRPFATDHGQSLTASLPGDSVWLLADATRLSQVFANLLHNSIKFTDRGGRITLRAWLENTHACVELSDTGAGIDPSEIPHLFDIFVQGEQPINRLVSGLGIGLALVRTLVEMHEGTVAAFSEGSGQGSRFVVRLPIHRVEASAATSSAAPTASAAPARILVVDDNVDAATTLAELLTMYGYQVRRSHEAQEAINFALADPPDAVLLDIGMPGMDGYEVARRMRAEPSLRNVQLIALSGFGREDDKRRALAAGFDAHLTKPAEVAALQAAIAGRPKPA